LLVPGLAGAAGAGEVSLLSRRDRHELAAQLLARHAVGRLDADESRGLTRTSLDEAKELDHLTPPLSMEAIRPRNRKAGPLVREQTGLSRAAVEALYRLGRPLARLIASG
jgi:hypothetical protein